VECTFSDNIVSGDDAAYGGGIYAKESVIQVTHSTFTGNKNTSYGFYGSFSWGGGIYASWSTIRVDECDFIGNEAKSYSDWGMSSIGGGIAGRFGASMTVSNSRFVGNIVRNEDEAYGGAVYSSEEQCSISNCLFNANTGDQVHASSSAGTNLIMNGCTVMNGIDRYTYYEPPPTGGVYAYDGSIRNCIIWDNPEPQLTILGDVTVSYSAIEGGWEGPGIINADPWFATGPNGAGYLSHAAAGQPSDSPCLDAGDPHSPPVEGTTRTDSVPDNGTIDIGWS
jgi:hypothetical protein